MKTHQFLPLLFLTVNAILCAQPASQEVIPITVEGKLVRKESVQIDSTQINKLTQEQTTELLKEVNKLYPADNILVQLIDTLGQELARSVSDGKGKFSFSGDIPFKSIFYLHIYGDGINAPPTRKRVIYVARQGQNYLPAYYIKEY